MKRALKTIATIMIMTISFAVSTGCGDGVEIFFYDNDSAFDHFEISTIPSGVISATAGEPFSIMITAVNKSNKIIRSFSGSANLSDETGTISPAVTGNFVSGEWTGDVLITKAGAGITISASSADCAGTSGTFSVEPGDIDHFRFNTVAMQTNNISFPITITAEDPWGNTVIDYAGPAVLSDTTGTITPAATTGIFSGGAWSGNVKISAVQTGVTITASDGATSGSSNPFNVITGVLDHFRFSMISNPQTAGSPFSITISAEDAANNRVNSFAGSVNLSDTTGTLSPASTGAFVSGAWTGDVTVTKAGGSVTISASGSGKSGASSSFSVEPDSLDHFTLSAVSSPQTAGAVFSITVTAKDQWNNNVTDYAGPASLSDTSVSILPNATGAFVSGAWTGSVAISTAGTGITITASEGAVSNNSNSFNVIPGALDHFTFGTITSPRTAGTAFSVTITAKDSCNNTVTGFTNTASLSDTTATISPGATGNFTSGAWTGNVTITKAQAGVSITAGSSGKSGVSGSFTVNPGALHHFDFNTISSPKTAGSAFSITITARDQWSNTVTGFTNTASLSDSTSTISPATTPNFASGAWTGNATITKSQSNITITATSGGISGASGSFNVNPGSLDHFDFAAISSPKTAGSAFSITITAHDQWSNTVTGFTNTVTLSDSTSSINPTVTPNFASGAWTGNVTITKSQSNVTITATGSGKSGASGSFNVNPGSLDHFDFSAISSPKTAGSAFSITITASDQFHNTVTGFTNTATLSDTTATITPASTTNFASGSWTGNVIITKSQAGITITATGSGKSGSSNSFTVDPDSLHHFTLGAVSSPRIAGTAFSIAATAKDIYDNTVTDYAGPADLSDTTASILPTATGLFTSGAWTGNVTISTAQSAVTITVSDGVPSGTTNSFTVNPGALDHFAFDSISSPKTAGTAFPVTITAKDSCNNTVTGFTGTTTLSDTTATISPFVTGNFIAGAWSGNVTIIKAQTGITITATGGGKSGTSGSFSVNPGSLDHFDFSTISSPKTAGTAFSVTITASDQWHNTVTGFTGSATLSDTTATITPSSTTNFASGSWAGNVTIIKAQPGVTITATGGGKSGVSGSFTVNPGSLDHFDFSAISSPKTAGTAFSVTITASDQFHNTVTGFTNTATLSDTTATITPASTTNFASGSWTGNVTIIKAQPGVTITATGGVKSGASGSFTVNPGALHHFDFDNISSQIAGTAFSITITARDQWSNTITGFTNTAALSDITTTISPAATGNFAGGVWTGNVTITATNSADIITAAGGGKTGTSNSFIVKTTGGCLGDGTFGSSTTYIVTDSPNRVSAADFNSDGIIDLAVSANSNNVVKILIGGGSNGQGSGTFTVSSESYSVGASPYGNATGDFNSDGITDIAVALQNMTTDNLKILLGDGAGGKGDGTFTPGNVYTTGNMASDVTAGDYNSDGIPDLAVLNSAGITLSILWGNGSGGKGNGTFTKNNDYSIGVSGDAPASVKNGDFNSDGILDIAVSLYTTDNIKILKGNGSGGRGDGTFTAPVTYPAGDGPWGIAVSDFNSDNIQDIAVCIRNTDQIGILMGNGSNGQGNGTFAVLAAYSVGDTPFEVVMADFNRDGIQDLAATNRNVSTISVLIGNGSGGRGNGTFAVAVNYTVGGGPFGIATADFNSDGIVDIAATANSDDNVAILLGEGLDCGTASGMFNLSANYSVPTRPRQMVSGDFNSDGIMDVAVTTQQTDINGFKTVAVLKGNGLDGRGDGSFTLTGRYGTASDPYCLVTGDFNADGIADLAVGNQNGPSGDFVSILLGNGSGGRGDGTFAARSDFLAGKDIWGITSGDFNSDGILDLAVTNKQNNKINILNGNGSNGRGDGTFTNPSQYSTGKTPAGIITADFNSDGILDLATANDNSLSSKQLSILIGNGSNGRGDGTFSSPTDYSSGNNPLSLLSGDFNSDGITDIATANSGSNNISVCIGNGSGGRGDGTFAAAVSYASSGTSPHCITKGDFNADGIIDLAFSNYGSGDICIRYGAGSNGRGNGTFNAATSSITVGTNPFGIINGYFDDDNIQDIAVLTEGSENIGVFLGEEI